MTKTNIDTADYEPFIEDGVQLGLVHWLRQERTEDTVHLSGLWKAEPGAVPESFDYPFHTDETIQVLEGSVTIDFPEAPSVTLNVGDLASFTKGSTSTWHVQTPFKKFFVCS